MYPLLRVLLVEFDCGRKAEKTHDFWQSVDELFPCTCNQMFDTMACRTRTLDLNCGRLSLYLQALHTGKGSILWQAIPDKSVSSFIWLLEIHKSIVEIHKSIVEIYKSIGEIYKSRFIDNSIVEKSNRWSRFAKRKHKTRCPTVHLVSGCKTKINMASASSDG